MSKNQDLATPHNSQSNQLLNPALQSALSSLDINLDEELARYRRQRRKEQRPAQNSIAGGQSHQNLDLIYVTAIGGRTNPASEMPPPPVSLEPSFATPLPELSTLPPASESQISSDPNNSPSNSPITIANPPTMAVNLPSMQSPNGQPDSYLESSEKLLESLTENQTPKPNETNNSDSLLSPLGIGSMLLFLMATVTFGYVLTNPGGFSHLNSGSKTANQSTPAKGNQTTATNPTPKPSATPLPTSPNLAAKEFVEIDLSSLSTLNPNPNTLPTAQAKPSVPVAPTPVPVPISTPQVTISSPTSTAPGSGNGLNNLSSALLPNSKQTTSTPAPTATSRGQNLPTPASTTAATDPTPAPTAAPKPATSATPNPTATTNPQSQKEEYYFVVVDYNGEQSLEKARQVVADAYTREFPSGVQIQLAAFNDANTAQILAQEFQRQGLAAKVYRP